MGLAGITARSRTQRVPLRLAVPLVAGAFALASAIGAPIAGATGAKPDRPIVPPQCSDMNQLVFGANGVTGSITAAGQGDCYQFKASAGTRLIIRVVATGGTLVPDTSVLNAKGATQCAGSTAIEQSCRVVSGGYHSILVRDATSSNTGTYSIYVQSQRTTQCTHVRFGHAQTPSIDAAGITNCAKFRGTGGDHMRFAVVATGGDLDPFTEIIKPDGNTLCSTSTEHELSCRLTATGSYTILTSSLAGTNTGTYTLYVQRLDVPVGCQPLTLGDTPLAASITVPGNEDCYTFPGTLEERLTVDVLVTDGSLVTNTEVIKPDGNDACPPTTETDSEHCLLASPGTYMLLIRDLDGTNTGSYTVAARTP